VSIMKAVRIHAYGGLETLSYEEAPRPEVDEGMVLIRVKAAGVNPFDWKARMGYIQAYINYSFPLTLGWEVSGVVEAIGPGVTGIQVGDEVHARADVTRDGGYAEYMTLRASEVLPKPASVDHFQAAAIPHAALAAWQALFKAGGLTRGQTVLIHGAAGGVGTIAVQLAKLHGARVIGTASKANLDFLRWLGVDEAIDYQAVPFETVVHGVDVVLDLVGGETQQRSWDVLKPGGILVSLVQPPSQAEAEAHGVRQAFAAADLDRSILSQVDALVDAGQLKPVVSHVFPLAEAQKAHALSETGHVRGKIVLKIGE
jgi:NADPH:quinone reductase-like Zn-dependent oxidoreductase